MKKNIMLSVSTLLTISSLNSMAAMKTLDAFNAGSIKDGNGHFSGIKTFSEGDTCIIPNKYIINRSDSQSYSDYDIKKETKLCEFDLNTQPLCPKLNSTNPGTLVLSEKTDDGNTISAADTTDSFCKAKEYDVKAKFKQSITCSYASSAIAAYHLSRILGTQLTTPVAVARSMDKTRHEKLIEQALDILSGRENEIIYKAWAQFSRANDASTEPKLYLNSNKGRLLYGALSENLKHENNYTEVSGVGPYDSRYSRFKEQLPFKRVSDPSSVEEVIGKGAGDILSHPALQQMTDVSNMIVLDTLLNQDDRIGNIHFYLTYVTLTDDGKVIKTRLKKDEIKAVEASNKKYKSISRWKEQDITDATKVYLAYRKKQRTTSESLGNSLNETGVLLREMVLKDNDCGVDVSKRSNMMKKIDALSSLRHISPITYYNLLKLEKDATELNIAELKNYFRNTLLYNDADYDSSTKGFLTNLKDVVKILKENCKSTDPLNHLALDLGIQRGASNQIEYFKTTTCELE